MAVKAAPEGAAAIISLTEALYFAFITGLTVGYGDIVATTAIGQVISVLLGSVGLLFAGQVVAMAVRALEQAIWSQSKNASAACSGLHGAQASLLRPERLPQTALRIQKAH